MQSLFPRSQTDSRHRAGKPYGKLRIARLTVRIFLLAVLQCTVVPRIGFFGAVPDILLSYLMLASVFRSSGSDGADIAERWKVLSSLGIFAGVAVDALGGVGFSFLPLFYFLVTAFASNLTRGVQTGAGFLGELLPFFSFLLPAAVLREGITLLSAFLTLPSLSLVPFFLTVLLPEFAGTLLYALPVWILFRRLPH